MGQQNDTEKIIKELVIDWGVEILESTVLINYDELKKDLAIIVTNSKTNTEKNIQLAKSLLSISPLNSSAMTAISKYVASDEFIKDNFELDTENSKFSIQSEDALNNLMFRLCNNFDKPAAITEDEQLIKVVNLTVGGIYKKSLLEKFDFVENRKPIKYKLLYPVLIVSIYKNLLTSLALTVVEKYFKLEK